VRGEDSHPAGELLPTLLSPPSKGINRPLTILFLLRFGISLLPTYPSSLRLPLALALIHLAERKRREAT
jgi:hypothetical protein